MKCDLETRCSVKPFWTLCCCVLAFLLVYLSFCVKFRCSGSFVPFRELFRTRYEVAAIMSSAFRPSCADNARIHPEPRTVREHHSKHCHTRPNLPAKLPGSLTKSGDKARKHSGQGAGFGDWTQLASSCPHLQNQSHRQPIAQGHPEHHSSITKLCRSNTPHMQNASFVTIMKSPLQKKGTVSIHDGVTTNTHTAHQGRHGLTPQRSTAIPTAINEYAKTMCV